MKGLTDQALLNVAEVEEKLKEFNDAILKAYSESGLAFEIAVRHDIGSEGLLYVQTVKVRA